MEFIYELKIPKDRIAVLIGKKGEVKRKIEEFTESKLNIDSKEGDIQLSGEDSLGLYTAKNVIQAIGRGFNPEIALLTLKSDYSFELVKLQDYVGKEKKGLGRIKARIIGTEGKTRKYIEYSTETDIVIYGKSVGIIGEIQNVALARKAIETLLMGSPHSSVYKWLEKKRKELRRASIL